jgi:hypothetical protein
LLVDLLFSDGSCVRIRLADQFTPQVFGFPQRTVTSVILAVASTYRAETRDIGVTAISAVTFMQRRARH